MPNPTPDFVQVRLTTARQQLAGAGGLRISNGRRSFLFLGDAAQKIERSYEWRGVLSRKCLPSGEPMFEIAPDAATAQPPATAQTPAPAKT